MSIQKLEIGVVGLGYVGNAVYQTYKDSYADVKTVDIDSRKNSTHTYKDLLSCEAVFICVPSPMAKDGSCDTSILEEVLTHFVDYQGVIISKVTAVPSVYKQLNEVYPNLVHVPEFLTAANADRDYANADFAIIGGKVPAYVREAERIIQQAQYDIKTHFCSIEEAALTKYVINNYLATKVVFMNEIKQLADGAGINYKNLSIAVCYDERIGMSHMEVPGPDGQIGYGGACFPKDVSALLKYAESLGVNLSVISAADKKNTLLRLT